MRTLILSFLLLVFFPLAAQHRKDLSREMEINISKHYSELEELYKQLHEHPELSQKEERTSNAIVSALKPLGYQVYENIGGFGVAAVLKNGDGPTVLIRTDMDALPIEEKTNLSYASKVKSTNSAGAEVSVMHACGHDLHMTVFIGTARVMSENKKLWKGTLLLIAQPSEENGLGAEAMIADGLYQKVPYPDYALALHNHAGMKAGTVGYSQGPFMASVDMMDITVFGKGGHGAAPHQTVDPIVLSAEMILAFQTIVSREINPLEPAVVTVGSVHGGTVYNIIPDQVKMQLTLRSYSDAVRAHVIKSIQNKSRYLALQAGLAEDKLPLITYNDSAPATVNDKMLTDKIIPVFRQVLGAENVLEMEPSMIGEDFSRFAKAEKQIPYLMYWLGTVDPEVFNKSKAQGVALPSLHSSTFQPQSRPAIITGIKTMATAAMELMK